jgi:ABC-type transporter Mla MlaB component
VTLRITRKKSSRSRAMLVLEGKVAAEWVALLERECSELLRSGLAVRLDLADVTFVDRAGVRTLRRLDRKGVEIRCRPGPVANVLEGEGIRITENGVGDERP